jgi:activator of 2-hydroxyglutaryl-CoA dehydratase
LSKLIADFGTSWTKLLDVRSGERRIIPSIEARELAVDASTGRNSGVHTGVHINELVALARGAASMPGEPHGCSSGECGPLVVLDIGARDMKYVRLNNGRLESMDWNNTCGALTGFTLELLGRYFQLDFASIEPATKGFPLTCGVLGMERVFDIIASGERPGVAIASFARGLAAHAHDFAGRPGTVRLSGGMCDNPLFIRSFPDGVRVVPLGRFVLAEGVALECGD